MRANTIILKDAAGDASGDVAGSLVFGPLILKQDFGYAIQAVMSGTPAGSLKLQASIDGVNWADITGSTFTISSAGTTVWNVDAAYYPFAKVVWTASGGSAGAMTVDAYVRGV